MLATSGWRTTSRSVKRTTPTASIPSSASSWRFKAGELVRVETYPVCYPELVDEAGVAVDLLAAEYELRRRQEPGLSIAEYLRRFPQHGDALRTRRHVPPDDRAAAEPPVVGDGKAETPPPRPSPDSATIGGRRSSRLTPQ